MEKYVCDKCGKEFTEESVVGVTRFFNYTPYPVYLCVDCARHKTPEEQPKD